MNLKDYKQVSIIYSTIDDSIFYISDKNKPFWKGDVYVKQIQRMILRGNGIFPLVVNNTSTGFEIEDGQHRFQAIKNINKNRNKKIEIPFYINWSGRNVPFIVNK